MNYVLPAIDMIRTGQRIAQLRKAAGLSVKDLQEIFGFATPQAIYKWQQGVAMPALDNLVVLSVVFGVKIDEIIITEPIDSGRTSKDVCEIMGRELKWAPGLPLRAEGFEAPYYMKD